MRQRLVSTRLLMFRCRRVPRLKVAFAGFRNLWEQQ
jgi:hypothetical protein